MNANQEQKTVESIKKVSSEYTPYLALALCWKDQGQTGLFYDKVPVSFASHPCDLFDLNGNREEWKDLTGYNKDVCEDMLPKKAEALRDNIAGMLQVSNFGRVGIPIRCKGESGFCKGCKGCKLNCDSEKKVYLRKKLVKKCENFHFILSQYESLFWNNSQQKFETYNGYLVVNINGEEWLVYELVTEAFKMKEDTLKKMEEGNNDFIDYIKEKCGYGDEENLKKAFNELKNADELQIHHIDNNGHHNTPTYWDENGTMIKGNLIALPDSVHKKIHKIKNFS